MHLDAQSIKVLPVITLGFGHVIGDEEDTFLCKNNKRIRSSGSSGESVRCAGDRNGDEYRHLPGRDGYALTYSGCVEYGGPPLRCL